MSTKAKTKPGKAAKAVRPPRNGAQKIAVLVSENPQRAGTKGHAYFEKFKTGMTVADVLKAGVPRHHLRWSVAQKHIRVG